MCRLRWDLGIEIVGQRMEGGGKVLDPLIKLNLCVCVCVCVCMCVSACWGLDYKQGRGLRAYVPDHLVVSAGVYLLEMPFCHLRLNKYTSKSEVCVSTGGGWVSANMRQIRAHD